MLSPTCVGLNVPAIGHISVDQVYSVASVRSPVFPGELKTLTHVYFPLQEELLPSPPLDPLFGYHEITRKRDMHNTL